MPIEIRELIIKTEVVSDNGGRQAVIIEKDLTMIREKLLDECKRMIAANMKKDRFKR